MEIRARKSQREQERARESCLGSISADLGGKGNKGHREAQGPRKGTRAKGHARGTRVEGSKGSQGS